MHISHRHSRQSRIDPSEAKNRLRAKAEELSLRDSLNEEPKLFLGLAFTAGLLCSSSKLSFRDCIARLDRILMACILPRRL
jgi:hypothetical protein